MDALRGANPYGTWPNEDFKTGCLALYGREKEAGTELLAIIGAMRKWLDIEEDRSGCWAVPIALGRRVMAPKSGIAAATARLYRSVQAEGNRWVLSRIVTLSDERGTEIGR